MRCPLGVFRQLPRIPASVLIRSPGSRGTRLGAKTWQYTPSTKRAVGADFSWGGTRARGQGERGPWGFRPAELEKAIEAELA